VERRHGDLVRALIRDGVTRCVHDLSDGGLLVAAAEMALASDVGVHLLPQDALNAPVHTGSAEAALLFGEDQGRYLIALTPDRLDVLDDACTSRGVPYQIIGQAGGCELAVSNDDGPLVAIDLTDLRAAHEGWMPGFMGIS